VRPVTVSIEVPQPAEQVFDYLAVLANHEAFLDHFLVDWKFSGPRRGVGAKAEARASAPMSQDWTDFEIVEVEEPARIVEEGVGLEGKLAPAAPTGCAAFPAVAPRSPSNWRGSRRRVPNA
jgi:hypothetical protein